MTKAEELYCGEAGTNYWERNAAQLEANRYFRSVFIRDLIPFSSHAMRSPWLEVGCGRGDNMRAGDVGLDCDHRQLAALAQREMVPIVGHAYNLSMFIDKSFPVVFSVGCLMHLPSGDISDLDHMAAFSWQKAVAEMARVSSHYIILGEYWGEEERPVSSKYWAGCLWSRPYDIPGFMEINRVEPPSFFDPNVTFTVWVRR